MNDVIFREYDIRGIVGEDLCIEHVYDLIRSFAYYFLMHNPAIRSAVVGMDVRTHSPAIKDELCRGLCDSGFDVIFIGISTSPMVYYAMRTLPVDVGFMITASHNPQEYNGIKVCLGTEMVHGQELQNIKELYKAKKYVSNVCSRGLYNVQEIKEPYIEALRQEFLPLVGISLPVVFDCANGSAGVIIPDLVKIMQWKNTIVLYPELDGTFPHHPADPILEENMCDLSAAVLSHSAVVGIGFDGDADRMGALTEHGVLVSGDMLLALFAKQMLMSNPDLSVVYDINASGGLKELLTQWGVKPIMAPCGHAHIKRYMREAKALLGGEISCHFFFEDRNVGYDDGIYAALRLLEILHGSQLSLSDSIKDFPVKINSPNYRLPCAEKDKKILISTMQESFENRKDLAIILIDGVHVSTEYGWGLVRASNTQAAICFKFEADTQKGLYDLKKMFADALSVVYPHDLYASFGIQDMQ